MRDILGVKFWGVVLWGVFLIPEVVKINRSFKFTGCVKYVLKRFKFVPMLLMILTRNRI